MLLTRLLVLLLYVLISDPTLVMAYHSLQSHHTGPPASRSGFASDSSAISSHFGEPECVIYPTQRCLNSCFRSIHVNQLHRQEHPQVQKLDFHDAMQGHVHQDAIAQHGYALQNWIVPGPQTPFERSSSSARSSPQLLTGSAGRTNHLAPAASSVSNYADIRRANQQETFYGQAVTSKLFILSTDQRDANLPYFRMVHGLLYTHNLASSRATNPSIWARRSRISGIRSLEPRNNNESDEFRICTLLCSRSNVRTYFKLFYPIASL